LGVKKDPKILILTKFGSQKDEFVYSAVEKDPKISIFVKFGSSSYSFITHALCLGG